LRIQAALNALIQIDRGNDCDFTSAMRNLLILTVLAFVLCGCFGGRKAVEQDLARAQTSRQKMIVTPANGLMGHVAYVNTGGRFVVLNFPVGRLPALNQHLTIYRKGMKVGEVKITALQNDDNLVADLLTGNSEVGDQVRER